MKISIEKNGPLFQVFHGDDCIIRGLITDTQLETYTEQREQLLSIIKKLKIVKRYEKGKEPKEGLTSFLKFRELLDIVTIDAPYITMVVSQKKNGIQLFLLVSKDLTKIDLSVSYSSYDFVKVGGLALARVERYLGSEDIKGAYKALDRMIEWDRVFTQEYRTKRELIQDELDNN